MDIKTVIKVENVGKTFRLPHDKNNSVKSAVLNFYKSKQTYEKQRALEDITFSVNKGEFFGIVGRNGSGDVYKRQPGYSAVIVQHICRCLS